MDRIEEIKDNTCNNCSCKLNLYHCPKHEGYDCEKLLKVENEYLLAALAEKDIYIHQLRGALGYQVPGHIRETPDILNGIADALHKELTAATKIVENQEAQIMTLAQEKEQAEWRATYWEDMAKSEMKEREQAEARVKELDKTVEVLKNTALEIYCREQEAEQINCDACGEAITDEQENVGHDCDLHKHCAGEACGEMDVSTAYKMLIEEHRKAHQAIRNLESRLAAAREALSWAYGILKQLQDMGIFYEYPGSPFQNENMDKCKEVLGLG